MFTCKYRRHRNWHYVSTCPYESQQPAAAAATAAAAAAEANSSPPFSVECRVVINERDTRRTIRAIALEPKIVFPRDINLSDGGFIRSRRFAQYFCICRRLRHIPVLIKNKHVGRRLFLIELFPAFPRFFVLNTCENDIYNDTSVFFDNNFSYHFSFTIQ